MLQTGDRVPAFELRDDRGETVTEASFAGRTVVLFFYPKDDTPGCTKEACGFRDGLEAFAERGAAIYGVSADDVASHVHFRDKYELNFPLIADPERVLCEAFGVWGEQSWQGRKFEGIARTTFLIRDGVIDTVYANVDVVGHVERVLADL